MVSVVKTETGTQLVSANLKKTIQSLKELTGSTTGNHSDTEVYAALKECNMDANEAAQKLLNQGPFHEVRRKRDKKKENAGFNDFSDHRKRNEPANHPAKSYPADRNFNNFRRGGFSRNNLSEAVHPVSRSREFRVVRDNRVNQNFDKETKTVVDAGPASDNHSPVANVSEKSSMGNSSNQKHFSRSFIPQSINRMNDSRPKFARDMNLNGHRNEQAVEKKLAVPSSVSHPQTAKQGHSQSQSTGLPSRTYVEGVYASASDPVHVPSPNSKSPAIKREVGVVGGHRHSVESSSKQASQQQSISNSNLVQGSSSTVGSFRLMNNAAKKDQVNTSSGSQSAPLNTSRTFSSQHHGSRQYQPPAGHQKGAMPSKEWRPKSSKMAKASTPGVIGTPLKSARSDDSKNQETDPDQLHAKRSEVSIQQVQNVVIAQHILVPENDRCRLTFGSFGMDTASSGDSASELQETGGHELTATSGSDEVSDKKQLHSSDEGVRNSGSISPSNVATEQQVPDEEETMSSINVERYPDTGFGRESSPPFSASEPQQHQDTSDMPNFAAYDPQTFDPQTAYDIPYFRHMDDSAREQTLPSHQEVLTSHSANSIAASSMAMLQQQQPLAQMYPQVHHVSHFGNVMPYRQFLSPVYVPPMGLPGYSGNPTYAHPSNGSSYVLLPGGSSHLAPGNMKFGVQQFKPVPTVSASGFGNFGSPTGYALNAPGLVGSATGLEDSSRLKYKDSNLYVPNPQAETSEVWMQNPRELPGMQSAPYYNMQGQAGHPAYMQSHAGHPSFNPAAVAQSSHMQFPGLYHHSQSSAAIPNPQYMAAPMGGSLGVGPAAPGAQVGAYQQQPQLGHLNWATNF